LTATNIVATSTTATSTFGFGLLVDTNTLVVNASQDRVGIGTLSPSDKLNVIGTISSGVAAVTQGQFTNYGASGMPTMNWTGMSGGISQINTSSGADRQLQILNTSGTANLGLYVQGNTGLGTTTPWGKLSVSGNSGDSVADQLLPLFNVSSSTPTSSTTALMINRKAQTLLGTSTAAGRTDRLVIAGDVAGFLGKGLYSEGRMEIANDTSFVFGQTNGYVLHNYQFVNGFWFEAASGQTSARVQFATGFDNDKQVAFDYTPGTSGAGAGVWKFGQFTKNNANYTHGFSDFYTKDNLVLRLNPDAYAAIGTTSPYARLTVWASTTQERILDVVNTASSSALWVSGTGFGTTTLSGLNVNGSATSTSNVGYNITTGCYAKNNVCISGGAGAAQTPWTGNIDGAGFNLSNAGIITGTELDATSTTATSTFAGGMTVDGTTFGVDYANNRVAIGTTPAFRAFTVTGASVFSTNASTFGNGCLVQVMCVHAASGTDNAGIFGIYSNFPVSNNEKARFEAGGRIGFGTSTPRRALLEIASSSQPQIAFADASLTSNAWTLRSAGNYFYFATSSPSTFATSTATALTIDPNGKIGIGSTSPTATLEVKGFATSVVNLYNSAGTKLMEMLDTGVTALLGTWDFTLATLKIPNSTAQTPAAAGQIAIDTTSDQLKYFGVSAHVVTGKYYPAFSIATTTTWTGTTTWPLGPAFVGETWSGIQCFTDVGTLNVSVYDGTNRMNMFNASTTVGTVTLNTNNTFVAAEKRYVDIGTPASAPKVISCTVSKEVTPD
jgi:hypothetical protein